jgi:hypothetical protein
MKIDRNYKMNLQKKESVIKKIDLMLLREKGMTKAKISRIVGIPVQMIDQQIKYQKKYKKYSGIF